MNVQCGICKDSIDVLRKNEDCSVASALPCGHVFHFQCISHWLDQSASKIKGSCPHCRSSVLKKQVVKLYLDLAPFENFEEEPSVIKALNQNLKREIETIREKLTHSFQNTDKLTAINFGLRERVLDLESSLSKAQAKERLLQVAQQKLNRKTKELENALDENKKLKSKLALLQATSAIINGSLRDFDDALPALEKSDLANLVYTYKKDVLTLGRKNEALFNDVSRAQEELRKLRKELERQKNDNSILSRIVEMYKPKVDSSPAQNSVGTESQYSNSVSETIDLTSPTGPQVVQKTNTPKIVTPTRKRLLPCKSFKNPHGSKPLVQVSPLAFSYDGLGGHSRVDEFPKFCSAKRRKIVLGNKVYKR